MWGQTCQEFLTCCLSWVVHTYLLWTQVHSLSAVNVLGNDKYKVNIIGTMYSVDFCNQFKWSIAWLLYILMTR
jgi:hypothetical protein